MFSGFVFVFRADRACLSCGFHLLEFVLLTGLAGLCGNVPVMLGRDGEHLIRGFVRALIHRASPGHQNLAFGAYVSLMDRTRVWGWKSRGQISNTSTPQPFSLSHSLP